MRLLIVGGCRVTTTTISRAQHDYALKRIAAEGLSERITVLFKDYRDLTGQFDKAVTDYDAALVRSPRQAGSLYGRGIAKLRLGNTAGGQADIAAAKAIEADVAEVYAHYGVRE